MILRNTIQEKEFVFSLTKKHLPILLTVSQGQFLNTLFVIQITSIFLLVYHVKPDRNQLNFCTYFILFKSRSLKP